MEDVRCEEICANKAEYSCFCNHQNICFHHARLHFEEGHYPKALRSKFSEPSHRWLGGHVKAISCLAVNRAGTEVVSGSLDRTAKVWNLAEKSCTSTLGLHTGGVNGVAFCCEDKVVVTIDSGKSLVLWDISTRTAYREVRFQGELISNLQVNNTSNLASVIVSKKTVVLVDLATLSQQQLRVPQNITKLAWHSRQNRLALQTENAKISIWDLSTNESSTVSLEAVATFVWVDDLIAVVLNNKSVVLASPFTGEIIQTLLTPKLKAVVARFDESSRRLVLATGDGQLYIEQGGAVTEHKLKMKKFSNLSAIEVKDSKVFFAASEASFDLYDFESSAYQEVGTRAKQLQIAVFCIDVRILATVCERDTVDLWKVSTGKQVRSFKPHNHGTASMAWCSGPNVLATGGFDNLICLWKVIENECVGTLAQHTGAVMCLDYQPESYTLASGGRDQTIRVWDLKTLSVLNTIEFESEIEQMKYTSTGMIACIMRKTEVLLANAMTGEVTDLLPRSGRLLKQMLAWCDKFNILAYTNGERVALINARDTQDVTDLPNDSSLNPIAVGWGYKSLLLAVGYLQKNTVKIWDIQKKVCLQELVTEVTGLSTLTWCYSSYLVTGGDIVGVWQVFALWNRVKGFLFVHGRNRKINYQVVKELVNFL
mmetsp:Transcript_6563/g.11508  ORF Transcript_6563/g.11508 Transcript_6563/m.11508 type:complete len:654 (+) Transcript_6563:987-2948(+)